MLKDLVCESHADDVALVHVQETLIQELVRYVQDGDVSVHNAVVWPMFASAQLGDFWNKDSSSLAGTVAVVRVQVDVAKSCDSGIVEVVLRNVQVYRV